MAQLAIKGHKTRGKEVIKILEMLGGKNSFHREGDNKDRFYYIDKNKHIQTTCGSLSYTLFTLEEFFEKFPYKVGDKILYKTYGIYAKIKTMLWNEEKEQVFYRLESNKLFVATADELQPYKEQIRLANNEHGKELMYAIQKTGERTKREIINKACKWLENELFEDVAEPNPYYYNDLKSKTYDFLKDFIVEFRKAMEE